MNEKVFEYGGYHFKAVGNLPQTTFQKIAQKLYSDRGLGISRYDWGTHDYSHESFLSAAREKGVSFFDVFLCVENGNVYVPCKNELSRYSGKVIDPTQTKSKRKNRGR